MGMLKINESKCLTSFLLGKKCIYCGHRKLCGTTRGYRKCYYCRRQKSLKRLKREILVISAFRRQQTALLTSHDLCIPYKAVKRIYDNLRLAIIRQCEQEAGRMSGEIELDEAYFGGRRKGRRGRGGDGKTFVRKGRKRSVHINGIEGFWSFAKHGLYNYRGVSRSMFPLYLKEMEYRYNHRTENLLNLLIRLYYTGYETG